jgi:hypothetical protein
LVSLSWRPSISTIWSGEATVEFACCDIFELLGLRARGPG